MKERARRGKLLEREKEAERERKERKKEKLIEGESKRKREKKRKLRMNPLTLSLLESLLIVRVDGKELSEMCDTVEAKHTIDFNASVTSRGELRRESEEK